MIVPAAIIHFCLGFEKYKKETSPPSTWNDRETKALGTSLNFTKIVGKVKQRRKDSDL